MDGSGNYVQVSKGTTTGPGGEAIHNDGIILSGVTESGAANTTMIDAPSYYENTFTWGGWPGNGSPSNYPEGAVYNNNFIKFREVSLAYSFPVKLKSKWKLQNLTLSLYGRNLFYIYKSLPGMDPEDGVGTNYLNQATSIGSGNAPTRSYGAMIRLSL
jgi:hypothetical protein